MRLLGTLFFLFVSGLMANAQAKCVILTGTIYDNLGSALTSAEINVTRSGDNVPAKAKTNDEGVFSICLQPGRYSVAAFARNFRTSKIGEYMVAPAAKGKLNLDLVLEIGRIVNATTIPVNGNENWKT